jgi:hypothetical protein
MIIWILVIFPLWLVVVARTPVAINQPRSRPLYFAFFALAISLTSIRTEAATWLVENTGDERLPDLIKHVFGMVAIYGILLWIISVIPKSANDADLRVYQRIALGQGRNIITAMAVVASLICFPFMATDAKITQATAPSATQDLIEPGHKLDRVFDQIGHPIGAASLEIFQIYLAFGMILCSLMCLDAYRLARRTTLGAGMALVSVGCASGFCYAAIRFSYLLLLMVGVAMPQWILEVSTNLFVIISVLCIVTGTSVPMMERVANMWSYRASLIKLRPLWEEVTTAIPGVLLRGPQPTRRHDRWGLRNLYARRQRRAVEIRDALLALQQWASGSLDEAVRTAASGRDAIFPSVLLIRVAAARCLAAAAPYPRKETAPLIGDHEDPLLLGYLEQISWALTFFQGSSGDAEVRKLLPSLDQGLLNEIRRSLGMGESLREIQS